ncbi:MAG: hypothetical protein HZB18_15320 [Chloroflexi bacterium]|nr:hypothetical protein [Chloroflexota bacterium]
MKKFSMASLLALFSAILVVTSVLALISNGNFETGDFTGWTKTTGINNGFSSALGAGGSDLSVIVGTSGAGPLSLSDAHTSGNLLYPAYGDFSARVNSDASYTGGGFAKNANIISQTYSAVLLPGDGLAHVRFVYSAVMVNPVDQPHTSEQKPYFRVRAINTSNGNDVLYDFSSYVGEPGKNWQNGPTFAGADFWQYLDWTYVDLASSVAHPVNAGDSIRLEITAAGCSLGGHPGYVYVDEISDGNIAGPTIQASGPATATAGSTIAYTYTYNNGSSSSIDPTIVINPPTNVTFTTLGDPINCSGLAPVTCNYTGMVAGGSGSFTISGDIALAAAGTTIAHGDYNIAATGFPTVGGPTVFTDVPSLPVTVTINQSTGQVDPTNIRQLHFTAVFSEAVTGFDSTDINVVLSVPCAPTITVTDSGDGITYYVSLTDMKRECRATVTIPADSAESAGRPGVLNQASTSTDNSQRFRYVRKFYFSLPNSDGWVLESTATSNVGGSINSSDTTMSVGDDANNRDYRIFSRFDTRTDPVPADAVIAVVNYRIKQVNVTGTNPLTTHGDLITELNKPYYGTNSSLELIDFQNLADKGACKFDTILLPDGFYRCVFFKVSLNLFPKNGVIDLRSRFELDDTDGVSDLLTVYSGNYAFQFSRPELFVAYYFLPTP